MRVPRKLPANMAAAVKAIVARQEETKASGIALENAVQHNAQITNADIVVALPAMNQGTGSTQRVGDKVKPVRYTVRGAASINDYGQGFVPEPITVRVMLLQAKGIRDSNLVIANADMANLLDNGGGTNSWDGSTLRSLWRINTDKFQVLASRTFKLGDVTQENTKSMTKRYRLSIKVPATLTYSPGTLYPSNFAPFFVIGWSRDDGSGGPLPTTLSLVNTAQGLLEYKDA